MKSLILLLSSLLILREAVGPPVTTKKGEEGHDENEIPDDDWSRDIQYQKYLKEVVQALESDPQFKEKLEKAETMEIRTGKIARELEFVSHHVRSKLDELKRQELERLRHLAVMQYNQEQLQRIELGEAEATGGGHRSGERPKLHIAPHLDHKNPHTFEVEDLRKLIVQTTKELEQADLNRRREFKQYELQKEFERQEMLRREVNEEQRRQMEKDFKENEEKHKQHPQLHHPGSKQQLEEVWKEQDHMNPEDFNPKTFFHLHDLDGNGVWDENEVKTLFQKELNKMYDPTAAEDDGVERLEEMERMREHVFNESDTNRDRLISYEEFLAQTKKAEFEQDQGWEGLDQTPAYTREEYEQFERERQASVQNMVDQGWLPPQPVIHNQHVYQQTGIPNQGYGQVHPSQQQYLHGNDVPQHHPVASNQVYHVPPAHLNQPPQAYHPGQMQHHPVVSNHPQQQEQHHPQGYAHNAGQHVAYQAAPHHPQVAHQGYAQHQQGVPQGYNQHQQPPHTQGHRQPVPPQTQAGGGLPHNPADTHQQAVPLEPAVVKNPQQAVANQHQAANQQMAASAQAAHGQGPAASVNNHNDNLPQNPNSGSNPHPSGSNSNPSMGSKQVSHDLPPHPDSGEQAGHLKKDLSSQK